MSDMTPGERGSSSPAAEYERQTQFIYQSLLAAEGVESPRVEHDIHIQGKSGHNHQIDVYWEFSLAGLTHRVVVSCKNYSTKVEISDVEAFSTILQDIGDVKGLMVTPVGYQPGAFKIANQFGIKLFHLRTPTGQDWAGRVRTIHLHFGFCQVRVTRRLFHFDVEWCRSHGILGKKGQLAGLSTEILILDASGKKLSDLYELESKLPFEFRPAAGLGHEEKFNDAYLNIPGVGPAKLNSIEFTYDIVRNEEQAVVGNDVACRVLSDAQREWKVFVDANGKVTGDITKRARER